MLSEHLADSSGKRVAEDFLVVECEGVGEVVGGADRMRGIVAGSQLAANREGVVDDRDCVAARVATGVGVDADEAVELDDQAGFLERLAPGGILDLFSVVDKSAGKCEAPLKGSLPRSMRMMLESGYSITTSTVNMGFRMGLSYFSTESVKCCKPK